MKYILSKMVLKNSVPYYAFIMLIGLMLLGCKATKKSKGETAFSGSNQTTSQAPHRNGDTATALFDYDFADHGYIRVKPAAIPPTLANAEDSLAQIGTGTAVNEVTAPVGSAAKSPVADKIVENYLLSENKEPKGHCLSVSKGRFVQAYKEVYGHLPYEDLPDSMASKFHTPEQVFHLLYASASETQEAWRSLPEKYRGKGNAGAIVYAGMGTLVDASGVWSGELRPGALMQVWRFKVDYEQVVQGVNVKELDPYGHSFIFISYVRDEKNAIIGLKIADQGFQSYRPLRPSDYEVWWGVNLSI